MKLDTQKKEKTAESLGNRRVVKTSKVKKGTNRQRETRKEAATVELKHGEIDPLTKIKLQLFPVNEITRIGLEKDGLNPFLELTLRARKKISSVIKHIHTKWGGSSIAIGEPMLLPYDAHQDLSRRWTARDTVISAGDVYRDVESPAVFRLRYGWFSDHEPQLEPPHNCIESESMKKQIENNTQERKSLDAISQVAVTNNHVDTGNKMGDSHEWPWNDDHITSLSMGGLVSEASLPIPTKIPNNESKSRFDFQPFYLSTDISIGGLLSEASLQGKLINDDQPPPIRWDDSLTALSIGGLLSEASLQAKINDYDSKLRDERNGVGPTSTVYDSFDAFISSQLKSTNNNNNNSVQVAKPDSNRSSILDAEETCNAFSFRKFSSSSKNVRVSARASQDLNSNSFLFPDLLQVDKEAGNTEAKRGQFHLP